MKLRLRGGLGSYPSKRSGKGSPRRIREHPPRRDQLGELQNHWPFGEAAG